MHHAGHLADLKAADVLHELGLTWFSFAVTNGDVVQSRHKKAPALDALDDIRGDMWANRMVQHLTFLISDPLPQCREAGLRHLKGSRMALLSRTKGRASADDRSSRN